MYVGLLLLLLVNHAEPVSFALKTLSFVRTIVGIVYCNTKQA